MNDQAALFEQINRAREAQDDNAADNAMMALNIGDDGSGSRDAYEYFMRPEPREFVGKIYKRYDEIFGREIKCRKAMLGTVRNAAPENRREMEVILEPWPHIRLDSYRGLQGWYQNKHLPDNPDGHKRRPRPCETDAILTQPYGGMCFVSCPWCYVNAGNRGYTGSGLTTVSVGYGDYVKKSLKKMTIGQAGYFSSFNDPFPPLEDVYHNTQKGAQAFTDAGLPIFFLSRLLYPQWAKNMLLENPYSYAQKSINTGDHDDWVRMSPGAPPLQDHMDDLADMKRMGIYTSIQINPIVAGITTHEDIRSLLEQLAKVGNDHCIFKFVEASHSWKRALHSKMAKKFGDNRAAGFQELFTCNIGHQTTIDEQYRINALKLYRKWCDELGMTMSLCYEYRYERDAAGNILNKVGVSMNQEFMTSDQCHGRRVPWHIKDPNTGLFKPMDVCPPAGCLTCGDSSPDKKTGACGSSILGAASAIEMSQMTLPADELGIVRTS